MLSLQTITTVTPIRSEAELAQAHLRLDELLAANAFDSPDEDLRNEAEVLTALISTTSSERSSRANSPHKMLPSLLPGRVSARFCAALGTVAPGASCVSGVGGWGGKKQTAK